MKRLTLRRRLALLLALLVAVAAGAAWFLQSEAGHRWARGRGHGAFGSPGSLPPALLAAIGRAADAKPAPHLQIELEPKHRRAIEAMRHTALDKGLIESAEQEEVRGLLRVGTTVSKIDLRLKGDYTDHLRGRKWSLRVSIDDGSSFLGMRRFSLQDPFTKGFHGESLFHETLRWLGVLAPRYQFADVDFCGMRFGIMAVEEHVATELLESQGRGDGVVVHFDEAMVFHGLDDYRQATIVPFGEGRLAGDAKLQAQARTAIAMLRGWIDGRARACDVFAVEPLAGFLACIQFHGSWHAQRWHNMRFYFDPLRQRLEPIGYDGNLQMRRPLPGVVAHEEDIAMRLLDDDVVHAAFERRLQELCDGVRDGSLTQRLREVEREALQLLHRECWLLGPFPAGELEERARFFDAANRPRTRLDATHYLGPLPLQVHAHGLDQGTEIAFRNLGARPVTVESLTWAALEGNATDGPLALAPGASLPLRVPAAGAGGPGRATLVAEAAPSPAFAAIEVTLRDGDQVARQRAVRNPPATASDPIPAATVENVLQTFPFVARDAQGRLAIGPGRHEVHRHLCVPAGSALTLAAGTTLRFAPGAGIVARGPVHAAGTADEPVRLEAMAGTWPGVFVLEAGARSRWSHATIADTAGFAIAGWQPTGAVTFARSDCDLAHCTFTGNRAEDALNIVHAEFSLTDSRVLDTASDAFDGDFVRGTVARCGFEKVGGDAVDFSGSDVVVEDLFATSIRDKAISAGERSTVRARRIVAREVGTGAASKDGSTLVLDDAQIEQAAVAGVFVYVKKAEYGIASATVADLRTTGPAPRARVQRGNRLVLDGATVPGEPIDVDALYATVMRKH